MTEAEGTAEIMFMIGMQIVGAARAAYPELGFTVLVHNPELRRQASWSIGVGTTLPSRSHMRALLANALLQACAADAGANQQAIDDLARADLAALDGEGDT